MRVTVALLAVIAAGVWAAPAAAAPAAAPPPDGAAPGVVTLISGDRVRVAPDGRSASRMTTPGREDVALVTQYAQGRLRVIPADAVPLLDADRLDPRLFDVTGLVADGYHERDDLPLIVTTDRPAAVAAVAGGPVRTLDTIGSVAVRVPRASAPAVWRALTTGELRTGYRKVWLDGVARLGVDGSVPLVGAPAAWASGWTGAGVGIGVLDTGVDTGHPDLTGTVAEVADFTGTGTVDTDGHGTHVASVLAGSGAAAQGRFRGMAPDARLYSGKVCAAAACAESAVLAGMQWAARDKGLRVVNLSFGRPDEPGTDLLEAAVATLTERFGTLFVAAAGNDRGRVWSPASAPAAIAVGAGDEGEAVAGFSNAGPDLVAPGVAITAARSGDSGLPGVGAGRAYATLSGTSMAAPHVAGAAALLAQQHPQWPPAMLEAALLSGATPLPHGDRSGAGRLDVAQAATAPVLATPGRLTLTGAGVRQVTYHNSGAVPLDLVLSATGDFTVDRTTLTVPARGQASARVGARPGDRERTGVLTAAVGDLTVHTALTAEARAYALTLRVTGRAGSGAAGVLAAAYGPDGRAWTGTSLRVPPGTYAVDAKVFEPGGGVTLLHRPRVTVTGDTVVDLDARAGRPLTVTAPGTAVHAQVAVTVPGGARTALLAPSFAGLTAAQLGAGRPGLRTEVAASVAGPDWLASVAWPVADAFVTGFAGTVRLDTLRATRADLGGTGPGSITRRPPAGGGWTTEVRLPVRRTEYLGPGAWPSEFTAGSRLMTGVAAGPVDAWNHGLYGPAFPPGAPDREPAFSADATHGGPPPGPVRRDRDRLSVGGSTWTVPPGAPLSAVRFEPRSATRLGFFVQHRVPGTTTTALDLAVSYDDGKTWDTPFYSRVGERGVVALRPGAGTVSLRVTAVNSAGSTVTQTMSEVFRR